MKTLLLLFTLTVASFLSNAQIINGNFEAPCTSPIPDISQTLGWVGVFSEEIVAPNAGLRSDKLKTVNSPAINQLFSWGSDTISGLILQSVNGPINNPSALTVSFAYKYTRVGLDTGLVLINLYDTLTVDPNDDVLLFQGYAEFTASTTSWGNMTIPVQQISQVTGTVNQFYFVAYASYNLLPKPGTTLWLDNITANGLSGIEENKDFNAFVFPNPATDVLNIKMNEDIASVLITALDGKFISNENASLINISELNSGMYLYTITTVSGKVAKGNFVKN